MPNDVVSRAIDAVCAGDHLTADHAAAVLAEIMEGRADPVQTGAFLIALRAKGETVPELVGLARTMRSLAAPVSSAARTWSTPPAPAAVPRPSTSRPPRRWSPPAPAARSPSTATAPTPASAAPPTCWRRSASTSSSSPSRSGAASTRSASASCSPPATTRRWRTSIPARKALGVRTIFNFLGPLTNPAGAEPAAARASPTATTRRRSPRRWSASAACGRWSSPPRTASTSSRSPRRTRVIEVADGGTAEWFVEPGQFGLAPAELEAVAGGTPAENAAAVAGGAGRRARPAPRPDPAQRRRRDLRRRSRRRPRRGRRQGRRGDRLRRGRKRAGAADRGDGRPAATRL